MLQQVPHTLIGGPVDTISSSNHIMTATPLTNPISRLRIMNGNRNAFHRDVGALLGIQGLEVA